MDRLFALFGKIFLILLVVGVIAAGAFYLGSQNKQKQAPQVTSNKTTASPSPTITGGIPTTTPTVDETETLKTEVKKALVKEHGSVANELTVTVSKIEGDYAKGDASAQGGGGLWFAAKQDGFWTLVWDGNGIIKCTDVSPFPQFPTDLIPECFDDQAQNMVNR